MTLLSLLERFSYKGELKEKRTNNAIKKETSVNNDTQFVYDLDVDDDIVDAEVITEPAVPTVSMIKNYLLDHHINDFHKAILVSSGNKLAHKSISNWYTVVVSINPSLLLDYDANLGNQFIINYINNQQLRNDFREAALEILVHLQAPILVLNEQLYVEYKLSYLPSVPSLHLPSLSHAYMLTQQNGCCPIRAVRGRISKIYTPFYEIISQLFQCKNYNLPCRNPNSLFFCPVGGFDEGVFGIKRDIDMKIIAKVTNCSLNLVDLSCTSCDIKMTELISDRQCKVLQNLEVTCLSRESCFSNVIETQIEPNVNEAQLGDHVEIIGTFERMAGYKVNVNCHSLRKIAWGGFRNDVDLFGKGGGHLPDSIKKLLTENQPNFLFSNKLVDNFFAEIAPTKVWRKLKLSLLLSLVSIPTDPQMINSSNNQRRQSVNVLMIKDEDIPLLSRVFKYCSKIKKMNHWNVSIDGKFEQLSNINKEKNGQTSISASPLTNCKDGIFITRLDSLNKSLISKLAWAIENPILSLPSSSSFPTIVNHNFGVWGHITYGSNFSNKAEKKQTNWGLPFASTCGAVTNSILGKFDIAINLRCSSSQTEIKHDEIFSEALLNDAMGVELIKPDISLDDFANFIYLSSNIQVAQLDETCKNFLTKYFTTLRALNGKIVAGNDSMFVTMETLIRLSIAHAKLCLRNYVTINDCDIAIMLVEESMALLTGESLLRFQSLPEDQESIRMLFKTKLNNYDDEGDIPDELLMDEELGIREDDLSDFLIMKRFHNAVVSIFESHSYLVV